MGIKAKEPGTALLFGFWRNFRAPAGTRDNRTAFRITTGHSADKLKSTTGSTPALSSRTTPTASTPPMASGRLRLQKALQLQRGRWHHGDGPLPKLRPLHNSASSPRYRQRPRSMASSSAADTWP